MTYMLQLLESHGTNLENYVVNYLLQLLARILQLSWHDDDRFKSLHKHTQMFLERGNPDFAYLGLKMLTVIVSEMNLPLP